ncbi:MAG: hypothetical protein MI864_09780 [Pseudomonadales bacterium]|nr:hypothetical protein [Pseudomonadales bacterium]
MKLQRNILIVGTYGIDIFYGIAEELQKLGCNVDTSISAEDALAKVGALAYHAILINLEPDGSGGVEGIEVLSTLIENELQGDAVCLGVSTQTPTSLLVANPDKLKTLSILVGWLTLPILADKAGKMIVDISANPGHLALRNRVQALA